ncbi:MAG: TonB-dependent receptor [Deltaproteobacteria bacterium]|nr:TonB-dependent receptor [Deltaproteobacteria bacterium]
MMKSAERFLIGIVIGVGVLIPSSAVQAGENVVTLEEVVVTATRDREEIRNVPANVTLITAEDIQQAGATSIVEILENLGSVNFRTYSGNPSQAAIDLRGFGGDNPYGKTLVMLDGRRLNRPDMASVNWLQIPVGTVERIEVVRGGGSVLYGDGAVAGVINIITKAGSGKPKIDASIITGSYGLHDEQIGVSGSEGRLRYAFNGENHKTFGYRDRSRFSSRGAGIDLNYDANDFWNVSFGLSYNETAFDFPGSLTKTQYEANRRQAGNPDDEGFNDYLNANLAMEAFIGDYGSLSVNVLYGNKDITADYASYPSYSVVDIDTYGITPKYVFERDLLGRNNKLVCGVDYYYEDVDKNGFNDQAKASQKDSAQLSRESLGFYIRDELYVLDDLILALGYRNERAKIKGSESLANGTVTFDERKIHRGEAFESALTWLFGEKSKFFVKYATVYRYPFLDEQASYYGYATDSFLTDLEKEKGTTYEAGSTFCPVKDLRIGLTLFRIDMQDEIVPNAFWVNENLDKTRHEGAEFDISYLVKDFAELYGNVTYHNAKFRNGTNAGKTVPLVPERMAKAGLALFLPWHLELRPEIKYVGTSYQGGDNSNTSEKVARYTMFDILLFYRPEPTEDFRFSVFVGVENLTDKKHAFINYGGYYPLPGLTVKGGISIGF